MQTIDIEGGIKIPVSKGKTFGLWLLCACFVAIAFFLFQQNPVMATLTISFFGLGVLLFPFMLFHRKSGLYITAQGINMVTPFVSESFIAWSDITGFSIFNVSGTKMILVHLHNPDLFLQKQSKWKRWLGRASSSVSGSPYAISAGNYQTDINDLFGLLYKELNKYRKGVSAAAKFT
ncbi:MAG TPA: STM3941 family protein [Chitinophagales bacterium]|nr:STM3941 family protein [Chitinophagales bacterium]